MGKKDKNLNEELEHDNHDMEHDYDGITEQNNPAPYWIVALFLVTICFSLVYAVKYFGYPDNKMDQSSIYERKMAEHKSTQDALIDAAAEAEPRDESELIAEGETLYKEKGCLACHGLNGEGNNIGPNLTDNYWINGCSLDEVINVIAEGRPTKGMTPYKTMMTPAQIESLSIYILKSLVGSNVANGKEAQGEECVE